MTRSNSSLPAHVISLSLVALMATCILTGCDGTGASNQISIGAALPLTGVVSYYGQDSKRGIDLALNEINSGNGIDGRAVRVVYEDTQGQGNRAVSAIRTLLDIHKVPAVIGGGTSTETLAMAPVAERTKRVLISPVSSASQISQAGSYIFRSVPSDAAQAESLARWIVDKGYTEVALIFVNQAWGVGLKTDFVTSYKNLGGRFLAIEATEQGEVDFRTQLVRMRSERPKAYVALIYAREGGLLLRQARELGITAQFFGADPWTKHHFIESAGDAGNDVLFTTPAHYAGPEFEKFAIHFREKYGQEPGIYEAHGYDTLMLLARAIRQGGASAEEIREQLSRTRGYMGATGETTFDDNGDVPTKGFSRMVWLSGEKVRIE